MEFKNFKDFGLEVIIKVLKKTDDEIKIYKDLEDYEGVKTLETDVLSKYEKLYNGFISEEIQNISSKQLKSLESSLVDIMLKNGFELNFIESEIKKRENLKGESGAEAVENLYKYQITELEKKKYELLDEADIVLDKEATLEAALSEAIQEEDQMAIVDQMPEVRSAYAKLSEKIMYIQNQIDTLKNRLEKKWPCDIYGTISKDQLMQIFKNTVK